MNGLGYEVGDTVYIFGNHSITATRVVKVTPSGLIDLRHPINFADGTPRIERWLPRGKQQGEAGNAWSTEYILPKNEQEERRTSWLRANREKIATRTFNEKVAKLGRTSLRTPVGRDTAAATLREMLAVLENWENDQ